MSAQTHPITLESYLPSGDLATAARYIDTRTRKRVTRRPALSPPSIGNRKLIHEQRTNNPIGLRQVSHKDRCRHFVNVTVYILPVGNMN